MAPPEAPWISPRMRETLRLDAGPGAPHSLPENHSGGRQGAGEAGRPEGVPDEVSWESGGLPGSWHMGCQPT